MRNQIQTASEVKNSSRASTEAHETRKNQMNRGKSTMMKKLILIFLVVSIVSCGNISQKIKNASSEPKLTEEQFDFCENFFIAIQVKNCDRIFSKEERFRELNFLFKTIKSNGHDDVINAFSIPEFTTPSGISYGDYVDAKRMAYCDSILKDLGIEVKRSSKYEWTMSDNFLYVYHYCKSGLKQPELKAEYIEELDNGNKIWLVKDYQSMTQARLIIKKDGTLDIGNITDFE